MRRFVIWQKQVTVGEGEDDWIPDVICQLTHVLSGRRLRKCRKALSVSSQVEWQANGVSIDTRTLSHGDIFVAIRGDRLDGHDYVPNAFENGAAVAIVAADAELADISGVSESHLIRVADTQDALEKTWSGRTQPHVRSGWWR